MVARYFLVVAVLLMGSALVANPTTAPSVDTYPSYEKAAARQRADMRIVERIRFNRGK